MERSFEKSQADWTTDLYKGACIYCTKQGEKFNIHASFKVPFLDLHSLAMI